MMSYLAFLAFYFAFLVIPGLALVLHLRLYRAISLGAIAISYTVFVFSFIVANHIGASFTVLQSFLILMLAGCLVLIIARRETLLEHLTSERLTPVFLIIVISAIYQLLIGAFVEVPADLYAHLERYQSALTKLRSDSLGNALPWKHLIAQKSGVFYYYIAAINHPLDIDTREIVELVDFANRTLFLIAIFSVTKFVFSGKPNANLRAYAAVAFTSLHMGINVFAFVRYYSLAPTTLALVLYFYSVVLFLNATSDKSSKLDLAKRGIVIALLTVAAAAVHLQEALFISVMIGAIALTMALSYRLSKTEAVPHSALVPTIAASLFMISCLALYVYSIQFHSRAPNAHWRLWDFGDSFWGLPRLTVLNLKNQFIQVVTPWGLVVYGLFFAHIARYKTNPFIVAGMLSPLITILNPFFVDTFLRHYNSTTLWRLCYLIPLHFVAADIFVLHCTRLRSTLAIYKKTVSAVLLAVLILLLLPWQNPWNNVHYSRMLTLGESDPKVSHTNFSDLLDFLERLEKRHQVLTDPMTGYMISGLTKHHSKRNKFFRTAHFQNFSFHDYSDSPLKKYSGFLLIINQRKKGLSEIGQTSGHWRATEWQVKQSYYPAALVSHVENNPDKFQRLWAENDISVYLLN